MKLLTYNPLRGDGYKENKKLFLTVPIINGGYTEFTNWTDCNVTCGGGIKLRTRNCTNPEPSNGGQKCSGPAKEIRKCNSHLCPGIVGYYGDSLSKQLGPSFVLLLPIDPYLLYL